MNPEWQDFLVARGARVTEDGGVQLPASGETFSGVGACALFDLSHLGLIAVRGEDAESFLQGQLTNDIREVTSTHTQLSSHLSPKGRMLACFRVLRFGNTIHLQLLRERLPEALKRLGLYVLRAKVALADVSDELIRVGIAGDCAAQALQRQGLALPERDEDVLTTGPICVLRLPSATPRFELVGPIEAIGGLWDAFSQIAAFGSTDLWALHDIRAGLPTVYRETVEAFVPHMVNLQLVDGVSFSKGCYTGQEVVARMQYLGKLKRRMYWGEVETDACPRPGDELNAPNSTSEQASGWIVDARPSGPGRFELLTVVEIEAAEGGEVRLGNQGPLLRLRPPPYGFPGGG
jgi:folate-binding protein YgfZ